jgi:hypothetical protein
MKRIFYVKGKKLSRAFTAYDMNFGTDVGSDALERKFHVNTGEAACQVGRAT